MSDNLGWNLPPGVTAKDISPPEPVECEECEGTGKLRESPCCGVRIIKDGDGKHCADCHKIVNDKCEECDGEGVIDP